MSGIKLASEHIKGENDVSIENNSRRGFLKTLFGVGAGVAVNSMLPGVANAGLKQRKYDKLPLPIWIKNIQDPYLIKLYDILINKSTSDFKLKYSKYVLFKNKSEYAGPGGDVWQVSESKVMYEPAYYLLIVLFKIFDDRTIMSEIKKKIRKCHGRDITQVSDWRNSNLFDLHSTHYGGGYLVSEVDNLKNKYSSTEPGITEFMIGLEESFKYGESYYDRKTSHFLTSILYLIYGKKLGEQYSELISSEMKSHGTSSINTTKIFSNLISDLKKKPNIIRMVRWAVYLLYNELQSFILSGSGYYKVRLFVVIRKHLFEQLSQFGSDINYNDKTNAFWFVNFYSDDVLKLDTLLKRGDSRFLKFDGYIE